jgi:thiamine kinase-like enzyme
MNTMTANLDEIGRIEGLRCWRGPIAVEPLPGGITNRNYLIRDAGRRSVARICTDRSLLGIDRRNEVVCQRAAHACGVAPAIAHHEAGVLVSRFVSGRTLTPVDVRDPVLLPRLAATLRTLHDAWDLHTGEMLYFCPFQTIRTYAQTADRLGARLPADLDALLDDARRLSRRIAPFRPALCHNDLLASNLIADDDRVWLVDWEYAGIGHPLFDLAGVCANNAFPESLEVRFLEHYFGTADERDLAELRLLKAMSSLREALWSFIQSVISDLDFDFIKYAGDNLSAYREARANLVAPPAEWG